MDVEHFEKAAAGPRVAPKPRPEVERVGRLVQDYHSYCYVVIVSIDVL